MEGPLCTMDFLDSEWASKNTAYNPVPVLNNSLFPFGKIYQAAHKGVFTYM